MNNLFKNIERTLSNEQEDKIINKIKTIIQNDIDFKFNGKI